jgi:ABC-type transport system involved in multi-copper enzyme maturation permease subunit
MSATTLTGPLTGFVNFTAKDTREWFRTRRVLWTGLAAQALILLGVLAVRIYASVEPSAKDLDWSPSSQMLNIGWATLVPLFAIFSTMGMLVSERDNKTLSWSLSMPLTRVSVLLSKLVTSIVGLGVLVVVLPLISSIIAVRLVYGDFPSNSSILWPCLSGAAVGLFCVVLNLFSNVFFKSQRGVVGIALCCALIVPGLIGAFWAKALPWWPFSMGDWIEAWGKAEPRNWITPVVFFAAMAVLLVAAQVRFLRDEM